MATRALSRVHRVRIFVIFLLLISTSIGLRASSGPHPLTITIQGSGTVARNPNFAQYPSGSVVTLTANPVSDWLFSL